MRNKEHADRWRKVEELFQAAMAQPPETRLQFLDRTCGGDLVLRSEVQSLLDVAPRASSFLEGSPVSSVAEPPPALIGGQKLGNFEILEPIGRGGMGEVYRARDLRLQREVALKVLAPDVTDGERQRFLREAQTASALNHPNIVTIHEVGEHDGVSYIAMELVAGKTLHDLIPAQGMSLPEALSIAEQLAAALAAAHAVGIVHRDLKPSNVMVTESGVVKVLDFGLAKRSGIQASEQPQTEPGTILGTIGYMSPEQAQGSPVDMRSDTFSFGSILYEMLSGKRAFQGDSKIATLAAIIRAEPNPLSTSLPAELRNIVSRCLHKERDRRYQHIGDVKLALQELRRPDPVRPLLQQIKRPEVVISALLILLVLAAGLVWLLHRNSGVSWAREYALPEIVRLIDQQKYEAAYALADQAEKSIPHDANLARLWPAMSRRVTLRTSPPGADVYWKGYNAGEDRWKQAGRSPLENTRVPIGSFRWKIEKKGFTTAEGSLFPDPFNEDFAGSITLDEEGKGPLGMVRVSTGKAPISLQIGEYSKLEPIPLEDYWLDRYEVTNQQFKQFVDQVGYQKEEYWKQQFRKNGRILSWTEAMIVFHDATGRPGPAGWVQGDYPTGQGDYPVAGVSWYEAAAYAQFVGKSLPTIWHWNYAAGIWSSHFIVPASNFGGKGPARVGSYHGIGPWGTYDMAGNVKEWCWNEAGSGKRYILGGGWDEPSYVVFDADARSPFDRFPNFGFRCAKYFKPDAIPTAATNPIYRIARNYDREKPVSDELFEAYRSLYSYDKTSLQAAVESIDLSNEYWKREKLSFAAAYGNERVIAYLFLPRKVTAPLQTVVYFPGVISSPSSVLLENMEMIDFLIKSGRAVMYPVYKGTYERRDGLLDVRLITTSTSFRDHVIAWSKDLGRSIDYLETRPEIDREKIAYFGYSLGAAMGAVLPAIEPRIKACIFLIGGLPVEKWLPEIDAINFAPRVKVPVLMLSGRYDFIFPVDRSQIPLYRLLGTPKEHKRHLLYDTSHNIPRNELIKETLDWLDRYLGSVK